jgi:hypothetical protein
MNEFYVTSLYRSGFQNIVFFLDFRIQLRKIKKPSDSERDTTPSTLVSVL